MHGGKVADDRGTLRPELVGHSHACEYVFRKVECDMELAPMHCNLMKKCSRNSLMCGQSLFRFGDP